MHRHFLFILTYLFAATLAAQQTRQFTLEELIPGGKEYTRFTPRIPTQFQWHGDQLMALRNDSVWIVKDLTNPANKQLFLTFDKIGVEKDSTGQSGQSGQISYLSFPADGNPLIQVVMTNGTGLFDTEKMAMEAFFSFPDNSGNHILSPDNHHLAYTIGNNLFIRNQDGEERAVTREENPGIVCGQAVHRNEFGIDGGIFWSPDGKKLAFYRMDETMVTDYPLVDISKRAAEAKPIKYPMAGMKSHHVTIGIHDTTTGETIYLKTGTPDEHYLTNIAWNPDASSIYVAELNRAQNHMKLNRYHAASGDFDRTLFEEINPWYVEPEHPVLFTDSKGDQFIWQSRRDGFSHLYLYDLSGKLNRQLTRGDWEVTDIIGIDKKGENLYFVSTDPTPMERHLYSVELKNGKITHLSTQPGIHSGAISHSGRYLTDRFSAHDNPGKLHLIDTRKGKSTLLAAADNPYEGIEMPSVESGTIKAADGSTDLYYRLVKPAGFDASKKYPVAVYVYGGPHSQMVSNRWRYGSGGWETYMAQKGYLVFVMDNRGTSYRGAAFEQVTHRQLGVEEAKDQRKGVEYLHSLPYVDKERMGIHGWSYGGFMTINMLLRYPGLFRVGVAGGPVIDWKYYEVMYGERYMDEPDENPEGYAESSLLPKAGQLKDRLLIIHGDEDPTVVMQHSLQFLKACIKAGTHPDFFIYPGHGHNMMGPDRVHLHAHITRYFEDFID
jgi:dipeptidyl-peptidase-4